MTDKKPTDVLGAQERYRLLVASPTWKEITNCMDKIIRSEVEQFISSVEDTDDDEGADITLKIRIKAMKDFKSKIVSKVLNTSNTRSK